MNDYKRVVSYIYSYPGGMKDRNVGFAKAEVRDGICKLNVSLRGVYTDTAESFGVYLCIERNVREKGSCKLLHIGNVMVKSGMGQYGDLLNASDINKTGYGFSDVTGIAVARENNRFYMMFGLWGDDEFNPGKVEFVSRDYKKQGLTEVPVDDARWSNTPRETVLEDVRSASNKTMLEEEYSTISEVTKDLSNTVTDIVAEDNVVEASNMENMESETIDEPSTMATETAVNVSQPEEVEQQMPQMELLFKDHDYIDAFSDDYCYDCVEVTLEQLKNSPIGDEEIVKNSFLEHGYYNFRHLLFGRVQKNERHTEYFIGVPGMYCNRERFMATMFGFDNFKKSHRSDYANPYFGYWYQEI